MPLFYTFKIQLLNVESPVVERTISVPPTFTFHEFHRAIQYAFDWRDQHLYKFDFHRRQYDILMDPTLVVLRVEPTSDPILDGIDNVPSKSAKVATLAETFSSTELQDIQLSYTYDFGDNWAHSIHLVNKEAESGQAPDRAQVLEGKGHAVAEDCGGIDAWQDLKDLYEKPRDQLPDDDKETLLWYENQCINADKDGLSASRLDFWDKDAVNRKLQRPEWLS